MTPIHLRRGTPADRLADDRLVTDPVTGQPAAIRFAGVEKSFGAVSVLRGLDLVVPRGRITFLVGGSGSGKSVTLKLAVGLLQPDKGQIWVDEDEITALSERKRAVVRNRFGLVFQHGALFDSMSVFDNVAFPLREHSGLREPEIARRVGVLLERVGLPGQGAKMPASLSGGMRKRVALARALTRQPRHLLYDEPTTGLDPILSAVMLDLIFDTHHALPDATTLVISHDMAAVMAIADKVVMLDQGKVRHEATPEGLAALDDPLVDRFLHGGRSTVADARA